MLSLPSSAKWSRIVGKKGKHERRETGKKDKEIFAENARFMPQLHYDYGGWKKGKRYIFAVHIVIIACPLNRLKFISNTLIRLIFRQI